VTIPVEEGQCLAARVEPDGARQFKLRLESGLYQLRVVVDGARFDWDRLYQIKENSLGEQVRTGPWDFDDTGLPLTPAFRVEREGRFVGVWVLQRISLEDLKHRRFRGRMAFRIRTAGECDLRLVPLSPDPLPWSEARVEVDPEDRLEDFQETSKAAAWDAWSNEAFWESRRALLSTPGFDENELRETADAVRRQPGYRTGLALFCAARLWPRQDHFLRAALDLVEDWSQRPAFGRTMNELAYGYRGDMDAMHALRALVQAHFILRPHLPDSLRKKMEIQLGEQAGHFVDNALITRDYWGGSLIQDHGWQSLPGAAAAVLNGRYFIPDATGLLAYLVPRALRSFERMPRDGSLGSHGDLWRYLGRSSDFRAAWRAALGRDLFEEFPFRPVIPFVADNRLPDGLRRLELARDTKLLLGGSSFFLGMAETFDDPQAAELARQTLTLPKSAADNPALPAAARKLNLQAWIENKFEGLLAVAEPMQNACLTVKPNGGLRHYPDSGMVFFSHPGGRLFLGLKCGPHNGWHAHATATGPCDRISVPGGSGHFTLAVEGKPVLVTPESPWQIRADLRSVLLINGHGQTGADIGYPNCVPSFCHQGEKIVSAAWDGKSGRIVLDLAPVYPECCGVLEYQRVFLLEEKEIIHCVDTLKLKAPAELCWLFQGTAESAPVAQETSVRFGDLLLLEADDADVEWRVAIRETPLVRYLRRDTGRTFVRSEFRTDRSRSAITAKFRLSPLPH